ncbi:GDSL-type esterase/lipase family protein [Tundrisphaera sp. TA3]|uniref:GDSL-type esterase/lipase family protein n=1 Tax=Tundrisphaera sp. TA3 TaxID=3435775 RepID=UPI003EB9CA6A
MTATPLPVRLSALALMALLAAPAMSQEKPKADAPAPAQEKPKADAPAKPEITNSALRPEDRQGPPAARHEKLLERTRQGDVDLLFLGDSITAGWADNATWKRYYGPRKAANFGIGGDRTQHILWRLENGEGDGLKPKVVVLMIGTNNLGGNKDEEIAEGVTACVAKIRDKFPEAKVLLLGIFPRGLNRDKSQVATAVEPRVARINEMISRIADGKAVHYLDIGGSFLNAEGQVTREIMPDFLHLSAKGYRLWAEAMEPMLWSLLEAK